MRWTILPEFKTLPEGWQLLSLPSVAEVIAGQSPPSEFYNDKGEGFPFLQGNADFTEKFPNPKVWCTQPKKICNPGATLISVRAPVGEINFADQSYALGRGLAALEATGIDTYFLYYGMQRWRFCLQRVAQGSTFDAVTSRHFRQMLLVKPKSTVEEEAITAIFKLTDEVIAKKRDGIAASQRLKKSLMQQLFTVGIPGKHNKFKSTKIGKIPEEWEVLRIQDILASPLVNGVSPQSRAEPPGTPILNVSCIKDGICNPALVTYVDVDEGDFHKYQAKKGDFYVLRGNGNRDYVGTGGFLTVEPDPPCIFSDKLIRLLFNPNLIVEGFIPLMWQNESFKYRLQAKANSGSGLWMLGKRDIRRELFAYPKPDEQREIVQTLDSIQKLIEALQAELGSLERLKCSLLQNLLTGKTRVNFDGEV